jgi:hypothetical protein
LTILPPLLYGECSGKLPTGWPASVDIRKAMMSAVG